MQDDTNVFSVQKAPYIDTQWHEEVSAQEIIKMA